MTISVSYEGQTNMTIAINEHVGCPWCGKDTPIRSASIIAGASTFHQNCKHCLHEFLADVTVELKIKGRKI